MSTITPIDVDLDTGTFTSYLGASSTVPVSHRRDPEDTVDVSHAIPMPAAEEEPEQAPPTDHVHIEYEVDQAVLDAAGADPGPWATEFARFIGVTTGQWIDADTISSWFSAYGARVQQFTYRQSAFIVANTNLPAQVSGDPAFLLLQLRQDITNSFKVKVGA